MKTNNFQIISTGTDYCLEPLTDMACSLAVHCRKHGDNLMYPTLAAAEEAVQQMDVAIANRHGQSWTAYSERR